MTLYSMVSSGGWFIAKGIPWRKYLLMNISLMSCFKAATVAIRYATVRRQGERGLDGLEKQIISYPSVYHRLLPILSRAYMFIQLGTTLVRSLFVGPIPSWQLISLLLRIILLDVFFWNYGKPALERWYLSSSRDACHDEWFESHSIKLWCSRYWNCTSFNGRTRV